MKPVRTIGYLSWRDPFAHLESMKGRQWNALLHSEADNFYKLVKQVIPESGEMYQEILDVDQYMELPPCTIGNGSVHVRLTYQKTYEWSWVWSTVKYEAVDLDVVDDHVWYVVEEERNRNRIICRNANGKIVWTKRQVASQIAVIGDLCYYLMVTDVYNTVEVRVCHAKTGGSEHIIYREPNKERDLLLCKTSNHTLYLQDMDPEGSKLFHIHGIHVTQLYKRSRFQLPIGADAVLIRQDVAHPWIPCGTSIADWILPNEEITYATLHTGHVLTIKEGARTIWFCAPKKKPRSVFHIRAGDLIPMYWGNWEGNRMETYIVFSPFGVPEVIHMMDNTIVHHHIETVKRPLHFAPLSYRVLHTTSADGTRVPYSIVHQHHVKPTALLVYVYGAYGASTRIDWPYNVWYPLLQRKWAIAYAMIRGGGDNDMKWANNARTHHRHRGIDDFESVIIAARNHLHIPAAHTVIYGRSAGGVPVGAMVSRYPDGTLMGAVYTEVPYVDMLRDMTNPALPLTVGEYKEFGNPKKSILDMQELIRVSPINTLPADGAPGVFVLTRVGLQDQQVMAYESFKWIQTLRGNKEIGVEPKGKFIAFDRREAHIYKKERYGMVHAIDLAILNQWRTGKLKIARI